MTDDRTVTPRRRRGEIAEGAILNTVWRVGRLVAHGGMGEVYEGENVHTGDRAAIKVLQQRLANDPKTQSLLRSEARKMHRIHHEAVVRYFMMAVEPEFDATYIAMDYIDGPGLGSVIGKLSPTLPEMIALMRRLAGGLASAHKAGVFHRDLSPDNILLPGGVLAEATIIDFGIAKDLDPSHSTIVGDGFAGKLGFVAPEQLGEFDSRIGPWTDIYSLGLTLLPLLTGQLVDMGLTPAAAFERRRAGVDVSMVAEPLRAIFARMLAADPADRFQTVDELQAALEVFSARPGPAFAPPTPPLETTLLQPGSTPPGPQAAPAPTIRSGEAAAIKSILRGAAGGSAAPAQPVGRTSSQRPATVRAFVIVGAGIVVAGGAFGLGALMNRPSPSQGEPARAEAPAPATAAPLLAPTPAASNDDPGLKVVGAWNIGLGCSDPVTFSDANGVVTRTFNGVTATVALSSGSGAGAIEVSAPDGSRYRFSPGRAVLIADQQTDFVMTKCG